MRIGRVVAVVGWGLVFVLAGPAWADKAAAELAFDKATALADAGNFAEACPLFETSYKADPQLGVLLNLADCHEHIGHTATAWAEFRDAIAMAHDQGDQREAYAQRRADALSLRLATLRIAAPVPAIPGLVVRRDETDITMFVGTNVPVDAGEHVITASAPGYAPWSTKLTIGAAATTTDLAVPPLTKLVAVAPAPATAAAAAPTTVASTTTDAVAAEVDHLQAERSERAARERAAARKEPQVVLYVDVGMFASGIPAGSPSVFSGKVDVQMLGAGAGGAVAVRYGLTSWLELVSRAGGAYNAALIKNGVYCESSQMLCGDDNGGAQMTAVDVSLDATLRLRGDNWYLGVGGYVAARFSHFNGHLENMAQTIMMTTADHTEINPVGFGVVELGREFGDGDQWDVAFRVMLAPDAVMPVPIGLARLAIGYKF